MIDGSVQSIRAVYDYALQILTYEITARCFFYIERCVVRGGGDVQTDDVIQERELQQRADGDLMRGSVRLRVWRSSDTISRRFCRRC